MNDATMTQCKLAQLEADDPAIARGICDVLRLPAICSKVTCRRANKCRGIGFECIRRHGPIVPPQVWEYVGEVLQARDDGLSQNEIVEEVEPFYGAFVGWVAGIEFARAVWRRRSPRTVRGRERKNKHGRERPGHAAA
jgi:hypothetical protein